MYLNRYPFAVRFRQYVTPGDKQFEPILEKAMQKEIYRLLLQWLKLESTQSFSQDKLEARALVVSWGIFGSALQWSRDAQARSMESMVAVVIEVVTSHF